MKKLRNAVAATALALAALAVTRLATGSARADGAAAAGLATVSFHVEGMMCSSCKLAVQTALGRLGGVKKATVDGPRNSATVEYDPGAVTPRQMADAVNRLGYRASLPAGGGS